MNKWILIFCLWSGVAVTWADVTLNNGEVVPTDSMLVYIFLGHSNMAGRADTYGAVSADSQAMFYSIYNDTSSYLWNYYLNNAYNTNYATGTWIPARWRLLNDFDVNPNWLDPAMPFLKKMSAFYPGYHLGAIEIASGYAELKKHYINGTVVQNKYVRNELESAILALQGKVKFAGVITMLGIIEVHNNDMQAAQSYRNDLDTLINRIRLLADDSTIPLMVTDLEQGARLSICSWCSWYVDVPVGDTITAQIKIAEQEIPQTRMVSTMWSLAPLTMDKKYPYYRDDHHFNRLAMMINADTLIHTLLPIANITPSYSSVNSSSISSSSTPSSSSSDLTSSSSTASSSSEGISSSSSAPSSSSSSSSSVTSSSSSATIPLQIVGLAADTLVHMGDTIYIHWISDTNLVRDVYPDISVDNGKSWIGIGYSASILLDDPLWSNVPWVIPDSVLDMSQNWHDLSNDSIILRLTTYAGPEKSQVRLRIAERTPSAVQRLALPSNSLQFLQGVCKITSSQNWILNIYNTQGQCVLHTSGMAGTHSLFMPLQVGSYFADFQGQKVHFTISP